MNWATYLRNHQDREDYNKNAGSLADLSDEKINQETIFLRTAESPTIVVASKSAVDNNIQPIFNLFTTGNTILKSSRKFGAFIGFGETATPITVLPKMLFSFSSQKFVPPFKDLLLTDDDYSETSKNEKEFDKNSFSGIEQKHENAFYKPLLFF